MLTQQEFQTWRTGNDQRLTDMNGKMDRMLDFMDERRKMDVEMEKRITTVEVQAAEGDKRSTRLSVAISAGLGAIVTFVGWLVKGN